ncbi:CLUMA_CG012374, isoform A [Clunio marinus]|uniref:CLUMA_CG012374, isoform A n=1 Tax=Clunio marinus TaxID=568069 RepID=A0A1J1IF26_9DIPT|nr:CLUMA_CG012374, isoform A [Clunio marinus]
MIQKIIWETKSTKAKKKRVNKFKSQKSNDTQKGGRKNIFRFKLMNDLPEPLKLITQLYYIIVLSCAITKTYINLLPTKNKSQTQKKVQKLLVFESEKVGSCFPGFHDAIERLAVERVTRTTLTFVNNFTFRLTTKKLTLAVNDYASFYQPCRCNLMKDNFNIIRIIMTISCSFSH